MAYYSSSSSSSGVDSPEDEPSSDALGPGFQKHEDHSIATERALLHNEAASLEEEHAFENSTIMNSRAYQTEMYDESMKRNIIVAMDTGSGKTQVAILRMKTELERSPPEKIVWFLAPTVSLCSQQFSVLKSQIPAVQIKFLSGNDNVDSWSDQSVWDEVLLNVRVVISTYQILLDALSHAFVRMARLSLIVFDEAHNCTGNSPGSKIMTVFYHEEKRKGNCVPHIMGLTASPAFGSKAKDIEALEATLDAVCKSPTIHRNDLLTCIKKPEMAYVSFFPEDNLHVPESLQSLRRVIQSLDILEDPYVLHLRADATDRSLRDLEAVLQSHDTYIQNQMTSFGRQAFQVLRELGPWAAEYYVWTVVTRFRTAVETRSAWLEDWKDKEKDYLARILGQIQCRCPLKDAISRDALSEKVSILIEQLLQDESGIIGIIFARERATVGALCHLLKLYEPLQTRYRIGSMVGTSQFQARKRDIWDLTVAEDMQSLQHFRSGKINLLVATSVLEEGIDVPVCNLVLCFDKPPNLKSFIQRRGRARMRESKLLLMLDESDPLRKEWEHLEIEMKRHYEDQERELEHLQEIEDAEESREMRYVVEKTGAVLDLDNAKQHLDHLCRILSPGEFIDWRPDYKINVLDETDTPDLSATVCLPSYLPQHVRKAKSQSTWKTEKHATKDAAFQAYVALHGASLVNDNLLPFRPEDFVPGVDKRAAMLQVNGLVNAWRRVAKAWKEDEPLRATRILLRDTQGTLRSEYEMVLPTWVPGLENIPVHLDHETQWTVEFGEQLPLEEPTRIDHTAALLALPHSHRWVSKQLKQIVRFNSVDAELSLDQIGARQFEPGQMSAYDLTCFIRDDSGCPFLYEGVIPAKPDAEMVQKTFYGWEGAPKDVPYLSLKKWSRRSDFLHRPQSDPSQVVKSPKPYSRVFPVPLAKVDNISASHAQFGVLIPSIMHRIETCLVAKELSWGLLRPLAISDPILVRTAISAGSACEPTNYERLEFLGDSILKFATTINVAALNPEWPERLLSFKKDSVVANSTLCKAAVKHGLDKFILTKPFTGHKWRPIYVDDVLQLDETTSTRRLSTKTLADIVEALIGVSTVDGGLPKALDCISIFLQEIEWKSIEECRQMLYDFAPSNMELPSTLEPLESLIGYEFQKKSLLVQSMTHASSNLGNPLGCLERLEFIGDSILDSIIVQRLFAVKPPLSHQTMHLLKTATVNGEFLGFLSLEHAVDQEEVFIAHDGGKKLKIQHTRFALPLWKFMRHQAAAIGLEQVGVEKRHAVFREPIIHAMERGKTYPWALLARLQLRKFYSDIFESLLGAVWVDSGSMEVCTSVVERFGIIQYLDRLIRDGVHALHPKEELGHLADSERVQYVVTVRETSDMEKEFACKIMVGERCVVEVDGGVTRDEIKVKAAEVAVSILKAEKAEKMHAQGVDGDTIMSTRKDTSD